MNVIHSEDYERCMLIAKESMAPYFLEYSLDWDDEERIGICRACDLYLVSDNAEVGFFMLREGETTIFLADIQILEKYRNLGYGTRVLDLARDIARSRGFPALWLKVFKSNPALNLYRRNGYVIKREEEYAYVLSSNT